ncbi:MAG: aminoacyl-tRNA hydrolase [Spirochaetales bacterium]|nr:aminoacyl-tRNA hydrolase [Spirochaetales bacterium]
MEQKALEDCVTETITFTFSRSGGPGGQNVNKLNTRVTSRLKIGELSILSETEKERIRRRLKNRITRDDCLVIHVQEQRSQAQNRERAIQRMIVLITNALKKKRNRIATQPTAESRKKRLYGKKKRGMIKKQRKIVLNEEREI